MRRRLLVLLGGAAAILLGASPAIAHPLGNFTVNTADQLVVTADGVGLTRVVDLAEIPTVQLGQAGAGVDYLNKEFLTPARGFPATVIQRSYTVGGNLRTTPAMTLTEGSKRVVIPARTGKVDTDCGQGQCSNLFEMSESVRRLVLHNEIPTGERFRIASTDVIGLNNALLGAEGWFEPAVARVLGNGAKIYGKPGEVPTRDCLDVTLIEARNGARYLLSATVPERQGGCPALVNLAQAVLRYLSG